MKVNASEWKVRPLYLDSTSACERTEVVSFTYHLVSWTNADGDYMRKIFAHKEDAEAREYAHRMARHNTDVRLDRMEVKELAVVTTTQVTTEINPN